MKVASWISIGEQFAVGLNWRWYRKQNHIMTIWEFAVPGASPRRGILGLDTTRGDRLFISLLGSAYIFLIWLAITDAPLWGPLAIAVVYTGSVFRWV